MKRIYHVGTVKGPKDTLIIQARRSVDFLSCEYWQYFGKRETTKKELKDKEGTSFQRVIVD